MPEDVIDDAGTLREIVSLNIALADVTDAERAYSLIASSLRRLTDSDYAGVMVYSRGFSGIKFVGVDGLDLAELEDMPPVVVNPEARRRFATGARSTVIIFEGEADVHEGALELYKALEIGPMLSGSVMFKGELIGFLVAGRRKGRDGYGEEQTKAVALLADSMSSVLDHMRTSHKLSTTQETTDRLMSVAPIGLMTIDSKGMIGSVNRQMLAILGVGSEGALVGTNVFEIPAVLKSGLDSLLMQAFDGQSGERTEVHFVPSPDKVFYLHVKVVPVTSDGGEIESALLVAMDVTSNIRLQSQLERSYEKLIQTYQELERVTKMKTQFIDIVSHELRTPLTVMRGYLDLLESECASASDPKFSQKLKTIRANTDKLYALVESMLDVSRLEKGTLQINVEPTKIDTVLDEVVKARSHDATEKKQSLSLEVEGDLPLIMADRRRIRDVFNNLLDNSIKYTEEGGKVFVGARDEGRTIHVWVRDNGVGIPLENLGRIFDRFFIVASNDLSHQVNRIGLSLPISKGIIEAHGGRIWVESQVGKGSVFHVNLPKESPG